jgi:hypothetical protein
MMSRVSVRYKPIFPAMAAVFSSRLDASTDGVRAEVADSEIDMRRLMLGQRMRRMPRLLWKVIRIPHGRLEFGGPRRSIDREFQEYSPPAAFD